ncbi:MAG: hypothetical protein AUK47_01265 [Deltaproteobacteria bacterium CG2_30_63_29]|nr:MAG: hypothetical protein AUK47_01265 [Deltaproteobacteria bacterium CG2_30_63_29]PJB43249.1 MAG: hypothetical protein CO108_10305 [Deltaproteobacteria bacterium CG_4_9_14_3_um_filter_63_12]
MRAMVPRFFLVAACTAVFLLASVGPSDVDAAPALSTEVPSMDIPPAGPCGKCGVSENPSEGALTFTPALLLLLGWGWLRRR